MCFGLCRKTAELSGDQAVEEGDERTQTQRADQRADADDASEQRCCNGADGVGCDAAPEVGDFALAAAEDDRQRVVGRDAGVGSLVHRRAETQNQNAEQHDAKADGKRNIALAEPWDAVHPGKQYLRDGTDAGPVDKGAEPDHAAGKQNLDDK